MLQCKTDLNAQVIAAIACNSANSGAPSLITAAGTGDATKVTGQSIDLLRKTNGGSGTLVTGGLTALTAAATLTIAVELQESADNSTWDTAEVVQAATTAATSAGGGNVHFVVQNGILLKSRKRYIRFNITPNLSAGATDTALFSSVFVIGGDDILPAAST